MMYEVVGNKIVSTAPFLQALATQSFILYTLHGRIPKHICSRIVKYCQRGFQFLQPIDFDGDFESLMAQEEVPLYRVENYEYIDDDGKKVQTTRESNRLLARNVDTFNLQENFISMVSPQMLSYY